MSHNKSMIIDFVYPWEYGDNIVCLASYDKQICLIVHLHCTRQKHFVTRTWSIYVATLYIYSTSQSFMFVACCLLIVQKLSYSDTHKDVMDYPLYVGGNGISGAHTIGSYDYTQYWTLPCYYQLNH